MTPRHSRDGGQKNLLLPRSSMRAMVRGGRPLPVVDQRDSFSVYKIPELCLLEASHKIMFFGIAVMACTSLKEGTDNDIALLSSEYSPLYSEEMHGLEADNEKAGGILQDVCPFYTEVSLGQK
ncbi:hypothetical protein AXF42_Ash003000 [Apostasia shenzhenica]|uniref:Uncharacterized protein n=1 Tax=Apostasia shenzhenica TaxID=1088818 RepID=A0A2I0A7U7_9ASPA|nr:hypothetical protein AXF42_Ash003000 [Apostasia shenzhenica]